MRLTISLALFLALGVSLAEASDVYIVRFERIRGAAILCHQALWTGDVLLYNRADTPRTVQLLDISNGGIPSGVSTTLPIQPREFLSFEHYLGSAGRSGLNLYWYPPGPGAVDQPWVIHLEVPDDVSVEGRLDLADDEYCSAEHRDSRGPVAKVSMPLVRRLTPPLGRQVILGIDVVTGVARQNVLIYNAGTVEALAQIEVRRACDDAIIDARIVRVAAHSAEQFLRFNLAPALSCPPINDIPKYLLYTVVTVDQPSFSMVSTITTSQERSVGNVTPLVEVAIAASGVL